MSDLKSYILRNAKEEDRGKIKRLVLEGRINPTGLSWERFVIAESNSGKVIGCGQIKPHRDGSHELASIVVTMDWWGKGVARAIIEHLVMTFDEKPLYLMCLSSMGGLYEKFGFNVINEDQMPKYFRRVSKLTGVVQAVHKQGETLLVMCKK